MTQAEVLRPIVQLLEGSGIPYMLTGSWASSFHGSPRSTADIDFVITASPPEVEGFLRSFPSSEYYFDLPTAIEAARRRSMFNVITINAGWKMDFIFHKSSPEHDEWFRRRVKVEIEGVSVFVLTPEDTLLSKLQWAKMGESLRQIDDAAGIVKVQGKRLDVAYIEKWVNQLSLKEQWAAARKEAELR